MSREADRSRQSGRRKASRMIGKSTLNPEAPEFVPSNNSSPYFLPEIHHTSEVQQTPKIWNRFTIPSSQQMNMFPHGVAHVRVFNNPQPRPPPSLDFVSHYDQQVQRPPPSEHATNYGPRLPAAGEYDAHHLGASSQRRPMGAELGPQYGSPQQEPSINDYASHHSRHQFG